MCDMQVVDMEEKHLDEVDDIEHTVFSHGWNKEMYRAELKKDNSYHYVLISSGKVIGYYGMIKIFEDAEVTNVAVKSEYQGKGLGDFLIIDMKERALPLGICNIFLEVGINNKRAIKLYEKHGFSTISIRKKYYGGNEDALVMKCLLGEEI